MKKVLAILVFSICISIPVILPFFHKGYFPTHDGEWAVIRLADMFRTLRDFQIPARYSEALNFGYGYPLFNFAYPFPYYLGVIIHFLGFGFVNTIKILFVGSVIFSAFFMFLASKSLWKSNWAGIASSILYVYFPYRMVDLYVRGSIGESLSFVLFPLLFYLAIKLTDKSSFLLIGGIAISVAFLVMTHNIMTVLFMPLYILFMLIQKILKNTKAIKPFFASLILSFGLSAFFWIPALFEKSNIMLSRIPITDRNLYFVTPEQFLFPRWGYGVPIDENGFSYQLGLTHLAIFIIIVLSLLLFLIKNKECFNKYSVRIACALTIAAVFFIFLLFKPSEFLWRNIPLLSEINYPWISLGILGFLVSLIAGFLSKQSFGKYIVIALGLLTIFIVFPYARPQYNFDKGDNYYITNSATTTSSDELMPLWVIKKPVQRSINKVEIIKGNGSISNVYYNSKEIKFSVNALLQNTVRINTIFYPGWKAYIDGKETEIKYDNELGVMEIATKNGKHMVKFIFSETPLRLFADVISILFFIALMTLMKFKTGSLKK